MKVTDNSVLAIRIYILHSNDIQLIRFQSDILSIFQHFACKAELHTRQMTLFENIILLMFNFMSTGVSSFFSPCSLPPNIFSSFISPWKYIVLRQRVINDNLRVRFRSTISWRQVVHRWRKRRRKVNLSRSSWWRQPLLSQMNIFSTVSICRRKQSYAQKCSVIIVIYLTM